MSEVTETVEETTLENEAKELELLKERADKMGIKYHPSIGLDKLREKVNEALKSTSDTVETDIEKRDRLIKEATKLVRVNVTCMDPNKKNFNGSIFSCGNGVVGTIKKFIPFNTSEGYHIPNILYKMLKRKKRQEFYTVKTANGMKVTRSRLVPAYAIEVLPPLTEEELKELARKQALNKSID